MSFSLLQEVVSHPHDLQTGPDDVSVVSEVNDQESVTNVAGHDVLLPSRAPESDTGVIQLDETLSEKTDDTSTNDAQAQAQEEADEDSDEDWDEISKGRYFGDTSGDADEGPLCHNCKMSGHKRKDCPHQLCRSCGALDDHDTVRCPMTQRCYNCSRLGHVATKCPEPPRQQGSFCRDCGSRSHLERSCPQIWRLYLPAAGFDVDGDWHVTAFCYNCAARGHYGDDCPKPHRARLIEQSAFCKANQPESSSQRSAREHTKQQAASKHQRDQARDLKDDWFLREQHHQQNHTRNGGEGAGRRSDTQGRGGSSSLRQERRYDPYSRPQSRPIITSERYPRGMPTGPKYGTGKRASVPAAQRLRDQQPTRGGKSYRGGGGRGR